MKHIKLFEDFNPDPAIDPKEIIDLISLQDIEALNSLPPDEDLVKRVIEILKKPENKSEREFINQMSCKIGESKVSNTFLSLLLAGASVLGGCGKSFDQQKKDYEKRWNDSFSMGLYYDPSTNKHKPSNPELSNLISDFVKENPTWVSNSFNAEESAKKLHNSVFLNFSNDGGLKKVPLKVSQVGDNGDIAFMSKIYFYPSKIDSDKVAVRLHFGESARKLRIPEKDLYVNSNVTIVAQIDKEEAMNLVEGKEYLVDFSYLKSRERINSNTPPAYSIKRIEDYENPYSKREVIEIDLGDYIGEISSISPFAR